MKKFSPKEALNDLHSILNINQALRGMDYLKTLVANIANVLNVKYVFIGHAMGPKKTSIQTDIVWANNDYHDNFVYELAKTPCENVLAGSRVCLYKENVAALYPEDELLVKMGVESYVGAPVLNRNGELSGLFVLLDDKPIEDEQFISSIVELLAIRIDTEMERHTIEKKLQSQVLERTVELEKANKKLQEANRTKDKFFSIIAHDLKKPFSSLLGFSGALIQNFDKYDEEIKKEFIKDIHQSSEHMYNLLDNLLTWSILQTDGIEYNPSHISLAALVDETINLLESNARDKKMALSSTIDNSVRVYGDVNMTDTIIRNLVSNAIKFTKEGGKVNISSKNMGGFEEISVSDTGVGISSKNIKRLFRIDAKHSTYGTNQEEGTGLGLTLCKEFVEKNGGTIRVESKPGKGSDFIFTVPLAGKPAKS